MKETRQMLLLVCNITSEAECVISLVVVVKPQLPPKPLRLKGAFLHCCFSELTLGEAERSRLVWLVANCSGRFIAANKPDKNGKVRSSR